MAINYASKNLSNAVLYCMGSTESLQEKLRGCYSIFHVLRHKGHLPPDLQKRFDKMIDAWTKVPDTTGKGTLVATLSKMDDNDVMKWLEEILSLYDEVEVLYHKHGPRKTW